MNSESEVTGFYTWWTGFVDVLWSVETVLKGDFWCAWQRSSHLVSRHSELLELDVKLWVGSRGGGKLWLCCGLPAAKQTRTCDSNYDLHKDFSLCKSERERECREREKPKLKWNVTFPPSYDVWRWHHFHWQGHLPWVKRCGSLIAAPGFGCLVISYQSHIQQYSVDKRIKFFVGKTKRSASWHVSDDFPLHQHPKWSILCTEQSQDHEAVL